MQFCMLKMKDGKPHVARLHGPSCEKVVMPVNDYYFCTMECLHEYNSQQAEELGIDDVMPDDGPGDSTDGDNYLFPARRRPDADIEPSPEEEEAAAAAGAFGVDAQLGDPRLSVGASAVGAAGAQLAAGQLGGDGLAAASGVPLCIDLAPDSDGSDVGGSAAKDRRAAVAGRAAAAEGGAAAAEGGAAAAEGGAAAAEGAAEGGAAAAEGGDAVNGGSTGPSVVDDAQLAQKYHDEQISRVRSELAANNLDAADGLLCASCLDLYRSHLV